jgi:hypothetical protein
MNEPNTETQKATYRTFRDGEVLAERVWALASPAQRAELTRRYNALWRAEVEFDGWAQEVLPGVETALPDNPDEGFSDQGVRLRLTELVPARDRRRGATSRTGEHLRR